jgi:hypothetical protein
VYFAIGIALMGFLKLTFGEINPFTLGFLGRNETMVGKEIAVDHNPIRIRDYSTMYTSPNGYFYYLILLVNLIGVRAFTKPHKEGNQIDTKLPSRAEEKDFKASQHKRRKSIDIEEIEEKSDESGFGTESNGDIKRNTIYNPDLSCDSTPLPSTRKFELFEKDLSMGQVDSLSQIDSETSKINSTTSAIFLAKFKDLNQKSTVVSFLLRLKRNPPFYEKFKPMLVLFWMMTYSSFKRCSLFLIIYYALSLLLSGNAFISDLVIGYLLGSVYTRFYFNIFER